MVKNTAKQSAMPSLSAKSQRWLAARQAYECYGMPLDLLSTLLGLKQKTVEKQSTLQKWQSLIGGDLIHEQHKLIKTLHQVVEAHFAHVAQLQGEDALSEKKTRALNTLAATIEKLAKLNSNHNAGIGGKNDKSNGDFAKPQSDKLSGTTQDFSPAELVDFRQKLAKRIEAFIK